GYQRERYTRDRCRDEDQHPELHDGRAVEAQGAAENLADVTKPRGFGGERAESPGQQPVGREEERDRRDHERRGGHHPGLEHASNDPVDVVLGPITHPSTHAVAPLTQHPSPLTQHLSPLTPYPSPLTPHPVFLTSPP